MAMEVLDALIERPRTTVLMEWDKDLLEDFVEFLNDSHLTREGYLLSFDLSYSGDRVAIISMRSEWQDDS